MINLQKPNELSAIDALERIRAGKLTSEELVESCLARIEKREHTVGAWQFFSPIHALATARESDNRAQNGKLQGIPVGIKDIFNTADMPTSYGSPIYKENRPVADASCVAQIRREGGIVLGKTVTTEFAFFKPGKTANPINPDHTPGGSSSGSAAAVADFMVPLALGSQTVGSTIRPASYCGVIGFKPSFGLIDRTGIRTLAETFDTVGIFSRTVNDAAFLSSIISRRPSLFTLNNDINTKTFGVCQTPEWKAADTDSREVFEKAVNLIDNAGGNLKEITLPEPFQFLAKAQAIIADFEAANSAAYELNFHREKVSESYIERAEAGLSCTEQQYEEALSTVIRAKTDFAIIMKEIDVMLCPSATGEAPRSLEATGDPIFNRLGTALQGPCLNVPGLTGHSGLPVGVQLIGHFKEDQKTLSIGSWLHEILLKK